MNHFKKTVLLISLSLVLTACGGGGGSDSGNTSTTPDNGSSTSPNNGGNTGNGSSTSNGSNSSSNESTGSVLENLDTSKEYRVIYDHLAASGSAKVTDIKQNAQGIVTEFGPLKLYGNIIGKEIDGNKNFALARITKGTVDYTNYAGVTETKEISTYVNGASYYFAYLPLGNKVTSATTKQVNCTDLKTTQARITNGHSNISFITPTVHNGSITLNPNGSIGVAFTVKADSGETSYVSSMQWIENKNVYNTYNILGITSQQGESNQNGTFAIGENGSNSFVVGSIYKITLSNGAIYNGLMSMTCNV